jgi:hypothetical protein
MTVREVVDTYLAIRAGHGLAEAVSQTVVTCSLTPGQLVDAFNAGILDLSRSDEDAELIRQHRNELLNHFNSLNESVSAPSPKTSGDVERDEN